MEEEKVITGKVKKSNKGLVITIIILALLLVSTSVYIAYDKFISSDDCKSTITSNDEKSDKVATRYLSGEEIYTIMNQIEMYASYLGDDFPIKDTSSINNQDKLWIAYVASVKDGMSIDGNEMEQNLEKYFGIGNFVLEDMQCPTGDGVLYKYDSNAGTFTFTGTHGHGGAGYSESYSNYLDGTITGDIIVVKANVLYRDYCGDTCGPTSGFYQNATNGTKDKVLVYTVNYIGQEYSLDIYKKIKDKLTPTIFTFKVDANDNYGLKSIS